MNQTPDKQVQDGPLRVQDVANIRGAYIRLAQLLQSKVVTPTSEAEIKGLREFLQNQLLAHADELLGSWIALHNEYQPLLQALKGIFNRVESIRERDRQAIEEAVRAEAASKDAPVEAGNIVSINSPAK